MKNDEETGTLRVVLDTNVLVSALHFPESALSVVWRLLLEGKYHLNFVAVHYRRNRRHSSGSFSVARRRDSRHAQAARKKSEYREG